LILAASSKAFKAVRGVVRAARNTRIAARRVGSSKTRARAIWISCRSRSVNFGALGRPRGFPDWPGLHGRRFL